MNMNHLDEVVRRLVPRRHPLDMRRFKFALETLRDIYDMVRIDSDLIREKKTQEGNATRVSVR